MPASARYVATSTLLAYETQAEALLLRIAPTAYATGAPYFRFSQIYRFDSPAGSFGTLYCASTYKTCFCETLIRDTVGRRVKQSAIDDRSLCFLMCDLSQMRLVRLYGDSALNMGLDHAELVGKDYTATQQIAQEIHDHPDEPHGMVYQSRFASPNLAVVLFDRAKPHVANLPGYLPQPLSSLNALSDAVRSAVKFTTF